MFGMNKSFADESRDSTEGKWAQEVQLILNKNALKRVLEGRLNYSDYSKENTKTSKSKSSRYFC